MTTTTTLMVTEMVVMAAMAIVGKKCCLYLSLSLVQDVMTTAVDNVTLPRSVSAALRVFVSSRSPSDIRACWLEVKHLQLANSRVLNFSYSTCLCLATSQIQHHLTSRDFQNIFSIFFSSSVTITNPLPLNVQEHLLHHLFLPFLSLNFSSSFKAPCRLPSVQANLVL